MSRDRRLIVTSVCLFTITSCSVSTPLALRHCFIPAVSSSVVRVLGGVRACSPVTLGG